ncbi:hypothetical protein LLH03_04485 [bacterium]|nr:hypothetical protein [bacterium]
MFILNVLLACTGAVALVWWACYATRRSVVPVRFRDDDNAAWCARDMHSMSEPR